MLPLSDIKILDLSSGLAGNLATMYLKSFGAEVVCVEAPEGGSRIRNWEPLKGGKSCYFNYLNSGKKSMTLNVEKKEGRDILLKLVEYFDVICVDGTPGEIRSLGLGYEHIKKVKKDIIYASCTPFGMSGPMKDRPSSSLSVQALGVAMDMTGTKNDYPVSSAPSLMEHYAAGYLTSGILMALIEKKNRKIGQAVDISLQDSIFSCIETAPVAASLTGEIQTRKGNDDPSCAPYDTYRTKDGYVTIGVATQRQWEYFCDVMGMEYLKDDDKYLTNEKRCENYENFLRPELAKIIEKMSKFEIEYKCREKGIPCCAVLAVDEIADMPNTVENGFILNRDCTDIGEMKFPALPFSLEKTPADIFGDSPDLGQDTAELCGIIGMSEEAIELLKRNKVI